MSSTPRERPISPLGRLGALPFIGLILLYRATLSHLIGGHCRFEPTCSKYGLEAYREHGPIRGTAMTAWRIMRCNPFVRGGYDPVRPRGACGCGTEPGAGAEAGERESR